MLGPLLCGLPSEAPLLPKLRGHFAEFLGNASSAGLGILSLPTCVGLRYGRTGNNSGFSRRSVRALRYPWLAPRHAPALPAYGLPACGPVRLRRSLRSRLAPPSRVPAVLSPCGTGISACRPSATRPRLALGPDSPREDKLHPGTLGHSAGGIPTPLSLLIPAFSLPAPPPRLPARLPRSGNAPLPAPAAFPAGAPRLRRRASAPDIFGAGALD